MALSTVSDVIELAYQHAKGKPTPPAVGTTKYNSLLLLCNSLQKQWAAEPDVEWNSLYSVTTIGTISATDTFAIPSTVDYISKRVTDPVFTTNGTSRVDYTLVKPQELYINNADKVVAHEGGNLVFPSAFTSDSQDFGWTLKAPCILRVNDIDDGADAVQVDDPMWLVWMVAADFVRNDLVRTNQYERLVTYAQDVMRKMKQRNQSQNERITTEWRPMGAESLL